MVPIKKSKNQQWKESGSNLSFKDWFRQDLNNSIHQTVSVVGSGGYSNLDGSDSTSIAAQTYKPYTTGSILGVNKYIIIGGVIVLAGAIAYVIIHKSKNK